MDDRGRAIFEPFRSETIPNISNIVRHRIIDDHLRAILRQNPKSRIVIIGAGFDTRAFRLPGGEWFELDEPQVIDYKNQRLPAEQCPNPLQRLSIEFASGSLREKLHPLATSAPTVIVIEGVFMYLTQPAIAETLSALKGAFPGHVLLCDLMDRAFFNRFAGPVHAKIVALGATFTERPETPETIFQECGYQLRETTPMFQRAAEIGVLWERARIPTFVGWLLLEFFMPQMKGYRVFRFDLGTNPI